MSVCCRERGGLLGCEGGEDWYGSCCMEAGWWPEMADEEGHVGGDGKDGGDGGGWRVMVGLDKCLDIVEWRLRNDCRRRAVRSFWFFCPVPDNGGSGRCPILNEWRRFGEIWGACARCRMLIGCVKFGPVEGLVSLMWHR